MAFKVVVSQKEVTHQIEVEDGKALNGLVLEMNLMVESLV